MIEIIKKKVEDAIEKGLDKLPFIARHWDVSVEKMNKEFPTKKIELGKYNAFLERPYPFYKSISRIIDINKIEE